MGYRMTYISKRDDSSHHQFRMRTPAEVLAKARGRVVIISMTGDGSNPPKIVRPTISNEIKFSLHTKDASLAKVRKATAIATLEQHFAAWGSEPRNLSHLELVALSGDVYRLYLDLHREEPGAGEGWAGFKAISRAAAEGRILQAPKLNPGDLPSAKEAADMFGADLTAGVDSHPRTESTSALEERFGCLADLVLTKEAIAVDGPTRVRLLRQIASAAIDAGYALKKNAYGDYSPDPKADRFPALKIRDPVSLASLFERWLKETQPAASTVATWKGNMNGFAAFLGNKACDIENISSEDVIRWKDKLVDDGLTGVTINLGKIAAIKALMNFAIQNRLLVTNPAHGVKSALRKPVATSKLHYSDEEVAAILTLARLEKSVSRRWLPLLCASSGARIGELAQLWGERVTIQDGVPVMLLAPAKDGGSMKNEGSERIVPLHPDVVAAGFLDFVREQGSGPLFYRRSAGKPGAHHASKGVANHLAAWIRAAGYSDPRKAPLHAFVPVTSLDVV